MNVEAILARLKSVRRSGNGWTALCPAHEDKKPSLSIGYGKQGIVLHCHAGCSTKEICKQLGMEIAELFYEDKKAKSKSTKSNGHVSPSRIVASYDYTDEHGELVRRVFRTEPKDFYQKALDAHGQWQNPSDIEPPPRNVLYHLPEIVKAPGPIYIFEGEKDVDRARSVGLVATCNAGGALKWRAEYSEFLRGKAVVIVADADIPGRQHADRVARSLRSFNLSSVKMLEFADANDFSEWMDNGGSKEKFLELAEAAAEWVETDTKSVSSSSAPTGLEPHIENFSLDKFIVAEFPSAVPLIEGLIERETRTFIVAKPKMMKSWLSLSIAYEAACGLRVFGRWPKEAADARPVRVLYCQFEDPKAQIQERLKKLRATHDQLQPPDDLFELLVGRSLNFANQDSQLLLEQHLDRFKPELRGCNAQTPCQDAGTPTLWVPPRLWQSTRVVCHSWQVERSVHRF